VTTGVDNGCELGLFANKLRHLVGVVDLVGEGLVVQEGDDRLVILFDMYPKGDVFPFAND
jgi:hypothetical protein